MIRSMTGFGAATREGVELQVRCEARSVNGRFLKVSLRLPQALAARESELEAVVRKVLRRGSVSLSIDVHFARPDALVSVDEQVVRAYQEVFRRLGVSEAPLATLPGVLGRPKDELGDKEWSVVSSTVSQALDELQAMRAREGEALQRILSDILDRLTLLTVQVRARAPQLVLEQHAKLKERLDKLLAGAATADPQLLAREIAVLADRSDIAEELDRLGSHLAQVRAVLSGNDEAGRTLDFLAQEMLRETNTIGSKSQDAELAHAVVRMKTEIERLKEQVANVE
jgi:uncharacterized protein (TIGR00255 family)